MTCTGREKSLPFLCRGSSATICGIWNGTDWNQDACVLETTALFETTCTCFDVSAFDASPPSAKEIFLDFAGLAGDVWRDFYSTLKVAALLSPETIAKNVVVFLTIGKSRSSLVAVRTPKNPLQSGKLSLSR